MIALGMVLSIGVLAIPAGAQSTTTTAAKSSGKKVKPLNPRVTVKVPDIQASSEGGLYTAMDRGYFDEQGIDIQLVTVVGSADQVPLLATGDLSVGIGAPSPTFFNAAANGIDLKFICTWVEQGKGDGALGLYVRKGLLDSGEVKSVADLKGRTIAISSVAEPFQLVKALESADLTLDDVNEVGLSYPDMVTALANGSVDATMILEPFGIQAENRGFAKRLAPAGDFFQGPSTFLTSGPAFAKSNPEALERFVEAFMKGQRDYQRAYFGDGTDKEAIQATLQAHTRLKDPALYAPLEAKQGFPRIEPNCALPPAKEMNAIQDVFIDVGSQPKKVKVQTMLDPSVANAALKKIGKADASVTKSTASSTTTTAAK